VTVADIDGTDHTRAAQLPEHPEEAARPGAASAAGEDGGDTHETPADTAPAVGTPVVETAPVDTSPAEPAPVDTSPADPVPAEPSAATTVPADPAPAGTAVPAETAPVDPQAAHTAPVDPPAADSAPEDLPAADHTAPDHPSPDDGAAVDGAAVDGAAVDGAAVDGAAVDGGPVDVSAEAPGLDEVETAPAADRSTPTAPLDPAGAAAPAAGTAPAVQPDPVEEEWVRDERLETELARGTDNPSERPVPHAAPAAPAGSTTSAEDGATTGPDEPAVTAAASTTGPADGPGDHPDAAEPATSDTATAEHPGPDRPSPGRPSLGRPTPGRPTPASGPGRRAPGSPGDRRRPIPAAPVAADAGSALREAMSFGRVDDDGTVFVRTAAGERSVGTWAPGEAEQALAFFARRFATLETEVELAESRARAGALGADATAATAVRLAETLADAQVVGDLDGLARRVAELPELALERREQRRLEKAENLAQARKAKEGLVAEAEAIGLSDTWRAGPDRLRDLFEIWQGLPRLDKAADDALWHRFSAARTTFTRRRRAHYNELAEKRVEVRTAKQLLIAEAEKLAQSTDWGPTTAAHRDLMARWKAIGSASKDDDDALWNRFHTARQAFFDARAAHDEARSSGEKTALDARRDVLTEAEALLPVTDIKAARRALRILRERWDAAGHVPRAAVAGLDARWKTVETAISGSEKQEWRRTDPEARRRADQAATQLRTSIAKLEAQAAAARDRGDSRAATQATEAAAARREWLVQAERVLTESR